MTVLDFGLRMGRLLLQCIGAYVAVLIALDQWWWTRRRFWRHLGVGILAILIIALFNWPS